MKRVWMMVMAVGVVVLVSGCASTGVVRAPLDRERPISTNWDPDDARATAEKMVDSMLAFPPVLEITSQGRPVLDVDKLQNRTMQHIDTASLTDSIRTKLLRSGSFRFVDKNTMGTDIEMINNQNDLGLVDRSKAVKTGKQSAATLYLYGAITEIKNSAGRIVDQYYKITLNLKSLESGELIWSDEQEIRKERKKPLIGG